MNLIFAKLFEEYLRKNDPAELKITAYISIFYFMLLFVFLLPIKTFLEKKIFNIDFEKNTIKILVFGSLIIIIATVYYVYIKKKYIYKITEKNRKRKLNKSLLYLIIVIIPPFLLILAATISVYLNGGQMLGQEIKGILE